MAYPISDVPRRIVYSGSVGVGPYAFTFEVLAATDIAVYKNGTLLTLTTDYTVSINTGTGTGTVTLVVAATGSDQITLVGDRAIERTSDFVTGGDLFANTLNTELDSLTIFAQQVDEKADRAIKAPVTDPTTINMTLPAQATRANKILGFNASGNPTQTSNTLVAIDAATTAINEIAAAPSGNAAGISFLQAGSGAVVRTAQSKMRDVVSVKDFGAVGDGVADDTVAIQAAVNAAAGRTLYFDPGVYMVQAGSSTTIPGAYTVFTGAVQIPSNSELVLHPDCRIQCITTSLPSGCAFLIHQASNVTIRGGGTIRGDRFTHTGVGGEQLHGISVRGSNKVTIRDLDIDNWWGDGILVAIDANGAASSLVTIDNVTVNQCRRNGLSITQASHVAVSNSRFLNTSGTAPECGVDVEPDPGFTVVAAQFVNCYFIGNAQDGFMSAPQGQATVIGLSLTNCYSSGNGRYGYWIAGDGITPFQQAATLVGCHSIGNTSHGLLLASTRRCTWTGGVVRANGGNGFYIRGEFNDVRLNGTSSSGTFVVGETVTNGLGASGTVRSWNAVTKNLVLRGVTGGAFAGGNTATGGTSGATLTVVAAITEPASAQNSIVGSQIHDNAINGIFFETTTESNVVDGCVISGNNSGVRIDTSFNEITGCRLTYNVTGVQLAGGASNFVQGCHFYGNQSSGVNIQNSTDNTVANCMVRSLGIQGVGITVTGTNGYNRLTNNDVYNSGRFANITRTDTTTVLINNMEVQNSLSTFQNVNSPESVVTAPVGSVYQRTDGGAGTSIYIKESGTGNTGWVAK